MTAHRPPSVVTGTIWPTPPGPVPVTTPSPWSVAIPAHDEERVIGRCLDALLGGLHAAGLDHENLNVAVVCNGCVDDTAAVARRHLGWRGLRHHRVLELPQASKSAALRLADAVLTGYPRLYLDADVELSTRGALDLVTALSGPGILAARPVTRVDTSGSGVMARRYARTRERLTMSTPALWGAGVYGLSEQGHARLGRHPDVTADDLWVDQLFDPHEVAIVDTDPVIVRAPKTWSGVLAVARRSYRGRMELGSHAPATTWSTARQVFRAARDTPVDAAIYGAVATWVRVTALGRHGSHPTWERDDSSR